MPATEGPTLKAVLLAHKRASAAVLALLLVMVAVTAAPALSSSSSAAPVSDSTSCSQWSAASQALRVAYSRLYINEHSSLLSRAPAPSAIESAVSSGCTRAAYLGEGDEITVVSAIKRQY